MATPKHLKMKEDAYRKRVEEAILEVLARLDSIEKKLTTKPKPKGGRNV